MPKEFYDIQRKQVTQEFIEWLKNLVGQWEPNYITLNQFLKKS
ncbi:hypothetical protein N752_30955 [Desulforamulus aquiferis]|nr:hypothetical protein [Desulforamulus aquiferis]RYD01416.1 hypothetical protein N752_30955 [Desulforamulus aquiferis]